MATSTEDTKPTETANSLKTSDNISLCSSVSAISSCPDRHGFIGGFQFNDKPKEVLSPAQIVAREKKWLHMMDNWKEYMAKNYKKVRERCRKGIPQSVRPRAWFYLSGAYLLEEKNPGLYEQLLKEPGNEHIMDDIKKDQHRTFPNHEMFVDDPKAHGQKELFNVLKAYSVLNPKVGYCQAQAPIAAFLLMHMPAEQAFWCFVSVSDKYLADYFTPGMEMLRRDANMLHALLKKTSPSVHRHLEKHNVEPFLYMTDWFLCAMTRTLPWDTLLRIWDCFLCEGIKVVFKVALVILGTCLGSAKVRKSCNGMCETIGVLRQPPPKYLTEEFIMHHIMRLNLTVEDFKIEHERQATLHRKTKSM